MILIAVNVLLNFFFFFLCLNFFCFKRSLHGTDQGMHIWTKVCIHNVILCGFISFSVLPTVYVLWFSSKCRGLFFVPIKAQACKLVFVLWFVWLLSECHWGHDDSKFDKRLRKIVSDPKICRWNKTQHKGRIFKRKQISGAADLSNGSVCYEVPRWAEGHTTVYEDPSPPSVKRQSGKHTPFTRLTDLALVKWLTFTSSRSSSHQLLDLHLNDIGTDDFPAEGWCRDENIVWVHLFVNLKHKVIVLFLHINEKVLQTFSVFWGFFCFFLSSRSLQRCKTCNLLGKENISKEVTNQRSL